MARSRNCGVISFWRSGWNAPLRRGRTRSKRRIAPAPRLRSSGWPVNQASSSRNRSSHLSSDANIPPSRSPAACSPTHSHYPLLTFICKGRPQAEIRIFRFSTGFADDHGCGDAKPDGRIASAVESEPYRACRPHQRYCRRRDGLARPRGARSSLHALSAVRSSRLMGAIGRGTRRRPSLRRDRPRRRTDSRSRCFRSRYAKATVCARPASWAASTRPSTWGSGTPSSQRRPLPPISTCCLRPCMTRSTFSH